MDKTCIGCNRMDAPIVEYLGRYYCTLCIAENQRDNNEHHNDLEGYYERRGIEPISFTDLDHTMDPFKDE